VIKDYHELNKEVTMRVLTVVLPRRLHKKIEAIKQKTGLSKSYIVRQLIIKYLDQEAA
jgi:metal-responsive CopG/Arc/MetJ family transcriptional regulator